MSIPSKSSKLWRNLLVKRCFLQRVSNNLDGVNNGSRFGLSWAQRQSYSTQNRKAFQKHAAHEVSQPFWWSKHCGISTEGEKCLAQHSSEKVEAEEDAENKTSLGRSSRKPRDSSYQLYVGNLPRFIIVKDLEELFTQYGTVKDVRFIFESKGGKSRVYGFIQLSSQTEVESAISALSGKIFNDRRLVVHEANVEHQA